MGTTTTTTTTITTTTPPLHQSQDPDLDLEKADQDMKDLPDQGRDQDLTNADRTPTEDVQDPATGSINMIQDQDPVAEDQDLIAIDQDPTVDEEVDPLIKKRAMRLENSRNRWKK